MDNTIVITFPRSGCHCIKDTIEDIARACNLEFSFCEYYNCCHTCPCKDSNKYMKNHDFLDDQQVKHEGYKYLILYRNDVIEQLEAWYRYFISINADMYNEEDCKNFITSNMVYYDHFIKKWVETDADDMTLKVNYTDVIKQPLYWIMRILRHIYPSVALDEFKETIENVVISHKISRKYTLDSDLHAFYTQEKIKFDFKNELE